MATRKRREHEQLRKELELRYKNVAKNMEYSPMVGCDMAVGKEGVGKKKTGQRICKHRLYGCTGGTNTKTYHSSERSKYCTFSGRSKEDIRMIREAYFLEHPEKRKEFERMYPKETPKRGRKGTGGAGMYQICCEHFVIFLMFRQTNIA